MKSNEYIQAEINDRYLQASRIFGKFYDEFLSNNAEAINYMIDTLRLPRWIIPNIIRNFYSNKYDVMITKGYRYSENFPITKMTNEEACLGFIVYYSALAINMKGWFGEEIFVDKSIDYNEENIKMLVRTQPIFFLRDTVDDNRIRKA